MNVILKASIPTHHTSTGLRNLRLKHYKKYGSGVHESWEFFPTKKEANEHIKSLDAPEVTIESLTGFELKEFIEGKEHHNIEWR